MCDHRLVKVGLDRRGEHSRSRLTNNDRWFLIQLYRWFPAILHVVTIVQPETLVRWHRTGFRWYWHWKSRPRGGRPQIETELRALIRRMSIENPLWGAPRIHGEIDYRLGRSIRDGQRPLVSYPAVSMVSGDFARRHDRSA